MKQPRGLNVSSFAVAQTLKWIRANGFKPVMLHPKSKAAVSPAYTSKDYAPPPDEQWQNKENGVGIVTGVNGNGVVDLDLDSGPSAVFAKRFMPHTGVIFGRASKRSSHRIYKVADKSIPKLTLTDPITRKVIAELRGDGGHQTVMPGSIHEKTGELIEWEDENGQPVPKNLPPQISPPEVLMTDLVRGLKKVGIAELISNYAWGPGYHNEPTKHIAGILYNVDWPLDEAVELIETIMEFTGDTDKSRLPTVRNTYTKGNEGRRITGIGTLREQLGPENALMVDTLLQWLDAPVDTLVMEMNEKYAVVAYGSKFRVMRENYKSDFMSKEDFVNLLENDKSGIVDDKGRNIPKSRIWLSSSKRRQYDGVDFLPGQDGDIFRVKNVKAKSVVDASRREALGMKDNHSWYELNLWNGWGTEPDPKASCAGWLDLLRNVICGGDVALNKWMLNWFAAIIRDPTKKSMTAPVLIGPEGAGKSLLVGYFGEILGEHVVTVTNDEHIHGRFNRHLATSLLLHSEEAIYGGDKKHAAIIRSLITDSHMMLEQKNLDAKRIRNFVRLIVTSNEINAATARPDDRRYTVIDMGTRKVSDKLAKQVVAEMHGTGPAALHHFLLNLNTYDWQATCQNFKSAALLDLKSTNMLPIETWWLTVLQSGQILPDFLKWAQSPTNDYWASIVSSVALYRAYLLATDRQRGANISDTMFAMRFKKMFPGHELQKSQRAYSDPLFDDAPYLAKNLGERQSSYVNLPSLDDCRAAYEKYVGQKVTWEPVDHVIPEQQADGEVKF